MTDPNVGTYIMYRMGRVMPQKINSSETYVPNGSLHVIRHKPSIPTATLKMPQLRNATCMGSVSSTAIDKRVSCFSNFPLKLVDCNPLVFACYTHILIRVKSRIVFNPLLLNPQLTRHICYSEIICISEQCD